MSKNNRRIWHISPDYKVRVCTAQTTEACPYSNLEELHNMGIPTHYESDLRPELAEKYASRLEQEASNEKLREATRAPLRGEFETLTLTHGDHYRNFQKIYSLFALDVNGKQNPYSINEGKRLSIGEIMFDQDPDKDYYVLLERNTGTNPSYVEKFTPFSSKNFDDEFKNIHKYEKMTKIDDGGATITIKDPFEHEPTWTVWKIYKNERRRALAYHFAANDVDGTFSNFMKTKGMDGDDGAQMWTPPINGDLIDDLKQIEDIKNVTSMVERNINAHFEDRRSKLEIETIGNNTSFNYRGVLSDGITITQIKNEMRRARYANPERDYNFSFDVVDDRERNFEGGWTSSWGVKNTTEGEWVFTGRPTRNESYEELITSPEEARYFIDVFENKHYDLSKEPTPGFSGQYIERLIKTINLEVSNDHEAYSHKEKPIETLKETIGPETQRKKKRGFLSLFS